MRVLSVTGAGLVDVPQTLRDHAKSLARQDALSLDAAGRPAILAECAHEAETFLGRLVVPVAGGRTVETILQIDTAPLDPIALMPRWPDPSGVELTGSVVERWESGAWVSAAVSLRAAGRVVLEDFHPGDYRVTVTATPAAVMPTAFVEGVSRLYALRTTMRPTYEGDDASGAPMNLSAALLRSGAGEILRTITGSTEGVVIPPRAPGVYEPGPIPPAG